jgi:hypothetical protein
MKGKEPDRKAIAEMDDIQAKFGGRKPEYILMLFAKRLDCLTKVLIVLTTVLALLTVVNIIMLIPK